MRRVALLYILQLFNVCLNRSWESSPIFCINCAVSQVMQPQNSSVNLQGEAEKADNVLVCHENRWDSWSPWKGVRFPVRTSQATAVRRSWAAALLGVPHAPLTLCLCFVAESFGQNYPEVRVQHCDFRNTVLGFEWKMYLDPFFFFF